MRKLVLLALFLVVFVVGNEAFTLRNVKPKEIEPEKVKEIEKELNRYFLEKFHGISREDLRKFLVHFMKAFGDREIFEKWYSISKTERLCVYEAQFAIMQRAVSGEQLTLDQIIDYMKEFCPGSAEKIQEIHELEMQKLKELVNFFMDRVYQMPKSVQSSFKKLYQIFRQTDRPQDEAKMRQLCIDFLQSLLDIPESDLKVLAEELPVFAPILTGDLKKTMGTFINGLIKHLKTGQPIVDKEFYRALGKLIPFVEGLIDKLIQCIMDAPEQDFPEFVNQGIEEEVDLLLDIAFLGHHGGLEHQEKVPEQEMIETEGERVKRECCPSVSNCPQSHCNCCA